MNRRQFLASLGIGAPAAVLAAKMGLTEKVKSYFFAPKGGWNNAYETYLTHGLEIFGGRPSEVIIGGITVPEIPFVADKSLQLALDMVVYSAHCRQYEMFVRRESKLQNSWLKRTRRSWE